MQIVMRVNVPLPVLYGTLTKDLEQGAGTKVAYIFNLEKGSTTLRSQSKSRYKARVLLLNI